ncbi:MAG: EF-P beta-lysylation protein EpmB [Gammaproteobacteria bacterium]
MLTSNAAIIERALWQELLSTAITQPQELLTALELTPQQVQLREPLTHFRLLVPRGFVSRMQKGNPQDPLLLQVLPQANETQKVMGYQTDPLAESDAIKVPGLLHKYHGRVLLTLTGACAIHCRYCFRQHFPYGANGFSQQRAQQIYDYILEDNSIEEVILSGGDPLILDDNRLAAWVARLETIPHLQRLRIHTRLPIVLPERINADLLHWLAQTRLQTSMVIHSNHPQEIDKEVIQGLRRLRQINIPIFNQAVLLKNVNDSAEILIALNKQLFNYGVLPYYLHMLDPVQGTAHFAVGLDKAKRIMRQMHYQLPGYLVPKLVVEKAYKAAKVLLPYL